MGDILTDEELRDLTGAAHAAAQAAVLDQHGIFYIRRRDAKIRTTWHHVHHPKVSLAHAEPDYSALDG